MPLLLTDLEFKVPLSDRPLVHDFAESCLLGDVSTRAEAEGFAYLSVTVTEESKTGLHKQEVLSFVVRHATDILRLSAKSPSLVGTLRTMITVNASGIVARTLSLDNAAVRLIGECGLGWEITCAASCD